MIRSIATLLTIGALSIAASPAMSAPHVTPASVDVVQKGMAQTAPEGIELRVMNPESFNNDQAVQNSWIYGTLCTTRFGSSMTVLRVESDRLFVLYNLTQPADAPYLRHCPDGTISVISVKDWQNTKRQYELQKVKDDAVKRDRATIEELLKEQ